MKILLSEDEISLGLKDLNQSPPSAWTIDKSCLHSQWQFQSFEQAIEFINAAALLANEMDHHPELTNIYNKVSVSLTTHDANGLTRLDFAMAQKLQNAAARLNHGHHPYSLVALDSEFLCANWANAFNNEDLSAMTSFYAEEALLWGTYASQLIKGQVGVKQYFKAVFDSGRKVQVNFLSQQTSGLGLKFMTHGIYSFTSGSELESFTVNARFSFVWQTVESGIKIWSHHSSVMPIEK